jgi:hypothetical protein
MRASDDGGGSLRRHQADTAAAALRASVILARRYLWTPSNGFATLLDAPPIFHGFFRRSLHACPMALYMQATHAGSDRKVHLFCLPCTKEL